MRALRALVLSVLAVVVVIVLLTWSLPKTLPMVLAIAGIDDVKFDGIDVGLRHARVDRLAIGERSEQTIGVIEADYSLSGLLNRRIDHIRIDDMMLKATLADGALVFDGLESGQLEDGPSASRDDGGLDRTLPLPAETIAIENSRVDIETPVGPLSLSLEGSAAPLDGRLQFDLAMSSAELVAEGLDELEATLELVGQIPLDGPESLKAIEARGRLGLEAAGMALPESAERLSLKSNIDFVVEDSRLTMKGATLVTGDSGDVEGALSMVIVLDDRLQPVAIDEGNLTVDLEDASVGGFALDRGRIDLRLAGPIDQVEGTLALGLDGVAATLDRVAVNGANIERVLDVVLRDRKLDLIARTESKKASIDQVVLHDGDDQVMESGWFTIQWPAREQPWLKLDLDDRRFELDWRLEIDPVRIDAASRFWARIEDLALTMSGGPGGIREGVINLRQGRVDLPSANLALTGIESAFVLGNTSEAIDRRIPLTIRAVRPLDEPRLFAPLRFEAEIEPETARLNVDGKVAIVSSPDTALQFAAWHDPARQEGMIDLDLAPLSFGTGGLKPSSLFPILDGVIDQAEGGLALNGQVTWREGDLNSDIELLIDELGFVIGPARLSRINSVIQFDSIAPLTTPRDQLLSVGLLDVGLPLTDGLVSMQLQPDGRLAVDQLTWNLANGQIKAEPFTFGSDVQDLTLMLKAEQLDLSELLRLTPLDELNGEGRIDGILPLTIGEAAAIEAGELAANGPGVLRYTPSNIPGVLQAGGESVRLMLQALENFRYEALKITLDGRTDSANTIGLHLNGANPDLYDGHPVEFNLNLEGNLASLIQANLDNYQIPDRIRERLQGFQR